MIMMTASTTGHL